MRPRWTRTAGSRLESLPGLGRRARTSGAARTWFAHRRPLGTQPAVGDWCVHCFKRMVCGEPFSEGSKVQEAMEWIAGF